MESSLSCRLEAASLTFIPGDLSILFMAGDIPKINGQD
jgi:hypothetical protein